MVLVLGVLAYLIGWRLGWTELMVVAAACLIVLALALPFVIGRLALHMERTLEPQRVTTGEPAVGVLRITNNRKLPTGGRIIEDHIDKRRFRLDIPSLGPGRTTEAVYPLPTERRGLVTVGPAVIVKADPLGLMRREIRQTSATELWVQPRVAMVPPLPVGFAKDLEGPTSDASPAGDVAFHALREYALGDDHRHIHWMSSARTGTLMVRHYVDNRRPNLTVVVDDRASSYPTPDRFDVALEIGGSLAMSSLLATQPVALWVGRNTVLGRTVPASPQQLLDRLTLAETVGDRDITDVGRVATRFETGTSALVVVTGPRDTSDLLALVATLRRVVRIVVIRVWPAGERQPGRLPGATLIDVDALETFQIGWKATIR